VIFLITGLPGHGKTYFTIAKAVEVIGASGRPVFYSGIPDLKLDWTESDAKRWPELSDGSVMVIDEAQRIFPVPPVGAPRGVHVTALETHRHRGLDLWLITQDANLLDSHVRRLVGVHYHVNRPFGMPFVNVLQWDGVHNPRDYHDKQKAVTSKFRLSSKVWNLYKSATVHTVRMRIPWKLFGLAAGVVAIPLLAFVVWKVLGTMGRGAEKPSAVASQVNPSGTSPGAPGSLPDGAVGSPPSVSRAAYMAEYVPRFDGLPWTAARYDSLTTATIAPVVTMCYAIWDRDEPVCECKGQNGAALPVDGSWCLSVIRRGFPFRDFGTFEGQASPDAATHRPAQAPRTITASLPDAVPRASAPLPAAPVPFIGSAPIPGGGRLSRSFRRSAR